MSRKIKESKSMCMGDYLKESSCWLGQKGLEEKLKEGGIPRV